MESIKVFVVDDERPARSELIYLLDKIGSTQVCGEAATATEALEKIAKTKPQLVFLDIQMEPINGITLAKQLLQREKPPYIIFATAYDKYAIQAFELHALDYILKPFSEERLKTAVERVLKELAKRETKNEQDTGKIIEALETIRLKETFKKIPVWKGDRIVLLDPGDIVYVVTSDSKSTIIKELKAEYKANYSLGEMEEKLREHHFFRPHRSYLVNLNYIKEIEPWFHNSYQLVMKNYEKEKIPVTRNKVKEFRKILHLT